MSTPILYNLYEMTSQNASQNGSLLDHWVRLLDLTLPVSPNRLPRAITSIPFNMEKTFDWQLLKTNLCPLVSPVRIQALQETGDKCRLIVQYALGQARST